MPCLSARAARKAESPRDACESFVGRGRRDALAPACRGEHDRVGSAAHTKKKAGQPPAPWHSATEPVPPQWRPARTARRTKVDPTPTAQGTNAARRRGRCGRIIIVLRGGCDTKKSNDGNGAEYQMVVHGRVVIDGRLMKVKRR
ncbi:unnamed protein product, partial [Iphiclides podalirius]